MHLSLPTQRMFVQFVGYASQLVFTRCFRLAGCLLLLIVFGPLTTSAHICDASTWTTPAVPQLNFWRSVIYGNGLFVAVGDAGGNRVMTACDAPPCSLTVSITATPSQTITSGGSVTLTASGAESYTWSTGSGQPGASTTAIVLSNVTSATAFSVTGVTGGCSATASATVSVTSDPCAFVPQSITITGFALNANDVFNFNGVYTPSSTTYSGTLQWERTNGGQTTYIRWTGTQWAIYAETVSGNISQNVSGFSTFLPCSGWSSGFFGLPTLSGGCGALQFPPVTVTSSAPTVESGSSVTLTASGADSFTWSNGVQSTSVVLTNLTSTTTLSVTGTTGQCSATASAVVGVFCSVSLAVSPSLIITPGQTVTLTASGADDYSWSTGDVGPTLLLTLWDSQYGITVTGSASTCLAQSKQADITVAYAQPLCVSVTTDRVNTDGPSFGGTYSVAANTNVTLTDEDGNKLYNSRNDPMGLSFTDGWYILDPYNNAAFYNPSLSATPPTTGWQDYEQNGYGGDGATITVTNCNQPCSLTVSTAATPSLTITSGSSVTLTASGAESYTWNTGETAGFIVKSPIVETIYSVTGSSNGCSGTATATVLVNCGEPIQADAISTTVNQALSPNNCSVTLRGKGYGTGYTVTGPGGYVFSAVYRQAGFYTLNALDVKQPGTYTFTVTYSDACGRSNSDSMTYIVTGTACK